MMPLTQNSRIQTDVHPQNSNMEKELVWNIELVFNWEHLEVHIWSGCRVETTASRRWVDPGASSPQALHPAGTAGSEPWVNSLLSFHPFGSNVHHKHLQVCTV